MKSNKYIICIPACIISIIARCIIPETAVVTVMGFINLIALFFVLYIIYNDFLIYLFDCIDSIVDYS